MRWKFPYQCPQVAKMLAPAKINLYLHITGKRPDGYHLLESLMIPINLSDEITVESHNKLELQVSGAFAKSSGNPDDNIVIKAARALAPDKGAKITLHKNIPAGAGLGGGSSDAATTLYLLNELWGLNYTRKKLTEIGLSLGADVPFFLNAKPAFVSGIGEIIDDAGVLPKLHILLVNPNKSLSTPAVFKHKPIPSSSPSAGAAGVIHTIPASGDNGFVNFLKTCRNDLEKNAIELMPEIADILSILEKQNGCHISRMSGSGATCFGIFDSEINLQKAAEAIRIMQPDWWVVSRL
jgi:4-diphosphocytidyl-2-C-methyl-D-erythritol kinase